MFLPVFEEKRVWVEGALANVSMDIVFNCDKYYYIVTTIIMLTSFWLMLINSTTIIVIFLILGVERDVVERSKATGAKYTGISPS